MYSICFLIIRARLSLNSIACPFHMTGRTRFAIIYYDCYNYDYFSELLFRACSSTLMYTNRPKVFQQQEFYSRHNMLLVAY